MVGWGIDLPFAQPLAQHAVTVWSQSDANGLVGVDAAGGDGLSPEHTAPVTYVPPGLTRACFRRRRVTADNVCAEACSASNTGASQTSLRLACSLVASEDTPKGSVRLKIFQCNIFQALHTLTHTHTYTHTRARTDHMTTHSLRCVYSDLYSQSLGVPVWEECSHWCDFTPQWLWHRQDRARKRREEEEKEKAVTRLGTVNSNPSRRQRSAETGKAVLEDINPSDTGHFPPCPSQPLNATPPSGGGTQVVPLSGWWSANGVSVVETRRHLCSGWASVHPPSGAEVRWGLTRATGLFTTVKIGLRRHSQKCLADSLHFQLSVVKL